MPGTGGVFDVHVDGELVFEKKMIRRYPQPDDVLPLLRAVMQCHRRGRPARGRPGRFGVGRSAYARRAMSDSLPDSVWNTRFRPVYGVSWWDPDEEDGMGTESDVETLGKGQLTLLDVIAQSIGFIGPVFASAFFISTIAGASFTGKGAGIAAPISIILAADRHPRRGLDHQPLRPAHPRRGSLYDYVTDGFGRRRGSSPAGSTTAA